MKIILSGPPQTTNTLYRRHGHTIYMTQEGKATKQSYRYQAIKQWSRPISDKDFAVEVDLYFPDHRRRDIDNWHKILLDSLTDLVWKDDSQIIEMKVRKFVSKEEPRIEIDIL